MPITTSTWEVKLKHDCVWAKAGHVVATEQFLLRERKQKTEVPELSASLQVVEERQYIRFRAPGTEISFDSKTGMMIGLRYDGQKHDTRSARTGVELVSFHQ